jgi:hypothetical protein
MPDTAAYEQLITQFDTDKLLELWQAIMAGETPGWEAGKAEELP